MSPVTTFALAGAVTLTLRCTPMLAANIIERARIERWLRLVSPAALAAIVAGAVALDGGQMTTPEASEIAALVSAGIVARRTRNPAVALTAGLMTYWAAGFVGAAS